MSYREFANMYVGPVCLEPQRTEVFENDEIEVVADVINTDFDKIGPVDPSKFK